MLMKLNELPIGSSCIVKGIEGEGKVRHRLFDMGITP
ncbi:MAG: ferrous iron transport protein A, partial [Bacilli bacterium]|nr:ferrous iron transport protein A [Bacilli bacterium]